jgi:hypothetical protein
MLIYVTSYSQSAEICDYIETYEFNDSIISNFAEPFEKNNVSLPDSTLAYLLINEKIKYEFNISNSDFKPIWEKLIVDCDSYIKIYNGFKKDKKANQKQNALSNDEYLQMLTKDKTSGVLISWTKNENKEFQLYCESELKNFVINYIEICDCGLVAVSSNMNYKTYYRMSAFQKGKAITTLIRLESPDLKFDYKDKN